MKNLIKAGLIFLLICLVYVMGSLLWATSTDFQPEAVVQLEIEEPKKGINLDSDTMSFLTWNIGYAGLGEESDFFYDDGYLFLSGDNFTRTPQKLVDKNLNGIISFVKDAKVDFLMLQEVDRNSKRSYYVDQFATLKSSLNDFNSVFATNFEVSRIPLPILLPWKEIGRVNAGLASFSRFQAHEAYRYQLPGEYEWPTKVFQLDRCLLLERYKTKRDNDLVVINLHFSAYDKGGHLRKQQLDFLEKLVKLEYQKGNYVVAAGDWNQKPEAVSKLSSLDSSWQIIYEDNSTTCRSAHDPYTNCQASEYIIDYFLLSPNLKVLSNETVKNHFMYSDHEAIKIELVLN